MDFQATAQLLGNFGEFFGALAVLVSLLYLASQVREARRSFRAGVQMQIGQSLQQPLRDLYMNPELMDVWQRGAFDYQSLSRIEKAQFGMALKGFFTTYASALYGADGDSAWVGLVDWLRRGKGLVDKRWSAIVERRMEKLCR
jgi:hypothetical protein